MKLSVLVSLLLLTFAVHLGLHRSHSPMTAVTAADDSGGTADPCSDDPTVTCGRVHIPIG